jgi:hypothetical protein
MQRPGSNPGPFALVERACPHAPGTSMSVSAAGRTSLGAGSSRARRKPNARESSRQGCVRILAQCCRCCALVRFGGMGGVVGKFNLPHTAWHPVNVMQKVAHLLAQRIVDHLFAGQKAQCDAELDQLCLTGLRLGKQLVDASLIPDHRSDVFGVLTSLFPGRSARLAPASHQRHRRCARR